MAALSRFDPPRAPAAGLVARYFRALPARRRLLQLRQAEGELLAGELARRPARPQPGVPSRGPACAGAGLTGTGRGHRVICYRLADGRAATMLAVGPGLPGGNAAHLAACAHVPLA